MLNLHRLSETHMKTSKHNPSTNGVSWVHWMTLLAVAGTLPIRANTIEAIPSLGGSMVSVTGINNNGAVSGFSSLNGEMAQHGFVYNHGVISDLGTLGGNFSAVFGLNDANQLFGDSITQTGESHAFRFSNGVMLDLGTLGGTISSAFDMNEVGMVVGTSFLSGNLTVRAFLFDGRSMVDLGTLGGTASGAAAINAAGQVVGDSRTVGDAEIHPFLYQNGAMVDLGTLGGWPAFATDINDAGVIVGESGTANMESHAFAFLGGSLLDLGTLGGTWSTPYKINEFGVIAGDSSLAGDTEFHGFVYAGGVMRDLGTLGGTFTTVHDLNNASQIVGDSTDVSEVMFPFLWENGMMMDLNSLLPSDSGWELWSAQFINDAGQIVGLGLFNGQFAWFKLTLETSNDSPVADAGPDQNHQCAGLVTLDGSASSDSDGDTLEFVWLENGNVLARGVAPSLNLSAGTHLITLRISDPKGATDEDSVLITMVDTEAPRIEVCPEPISVGAGPENVAAVPELKNSILVTDNCSASEALIRMQEPMAGTMLEIGSHQVVIGVADEAGNIASCVTTFMVEDQTAPHVACPDSTVLRANQEEWAEVPSLLDRVLVSDNWSAVDKIRLVQNPKPGTLVRVGPHAVIVTAIDEAGNQSSCQSPLLVEEPLCLPQVRSVSAVPNLLTKVNRDMVPIELVPVIDAGCETPVASEVVEVLSSDPVTGTGDNTSPDWELTGPLSLNVRAEASPKSDGRTYTIVVRSTDALGNTSVHRAEVNVLRKMNGK